jgi:hypothetical protein
MMKLADFVFLQFPCPFPTHREIASVERVYNKGLVADVNYSTDAIARVEGGSCSRVILHSAMVITVLNLL